MTTATATRKRKERGGKKKETKKEEKKDGAPFRLLDVSLCSIHVGERQKIHVLERCGSQLSESGERLSPSPGWRAGQGQRRASPIEFKKKNGFPPSPPPQASSPRVLERPDLVGVQNHAVSLLVAQGASLGKGDGRKRRGHGEDEQEGERAHRRRRAEASDHRSPFALCLLPLVRRLGGKWVRRQRLLL